MDRLIRLANTDKSNSVNIHVTGIGVKYQKNPDGSNAVDANGVKLQEGAKKRPDKIIGQK